MTHITLNLIVIRSSDIDRAAAFYGALGLEFTRHRHGEGPEHCGTEMAAGDGPPLIFEIYPATSPNDLRDAVRLGFSVDDVDAALAALVAAGGTIISRPRDSEWGRRAVVADRDGHRVELTQREYCLRQTRDA